MAGLALGTERLGLDFLLEPQRHQHSSQSPVASAVRPGIQSLRSQVPRLRTGAEGAQDTPDYRHVPMKHDWKSSGPAGLGGLPSGRPPSSLGQYSSPSPMSMGADTPPPNSLPRGGGPISPYGAPSSAGSISGSVRGTGTGSSPYDELASIPVKNCSPTCPLDALLIDFLAERRQRGAEGLSTSEVVGPRYPSVSSLLNPAQSVYSHPLSKFFTDILATFPDISALPERVAVLYIMFLVMRWQISPTQENYHRLPSWMRPLRVQLSKSHPAWIDHVPFPLMRERLVRDYNQEIYPFDNFFVPFTTTLSLNWSYEDTKVLLQSPDGSELMINPVFEEHLMKVENWTLGTAFKMAFPSLYGTFGLRDRAKKDDSSSGSSGTATFRREVEEREPERSPKGASDADHGAVDGNNQCYSVAGNGHTYASAQGHGHAYENANTTGVGLGFESGAGNQPGTAGHEAHGYANNGREHRR